MCYSFSFMKFDCFDNIPNCDKSDKDCVLWEGARDTIRVVVVPTN